VLRSSIKSAIDVVSSSFEKKLKPFPIELTDFQKTIILSDIGIDNIIDLEEKFNCKLVVNSIKKELEVMCRFEYIKQIRQ
jgi:hypothetical protein